MDKAEFFCSLGMSLYETKAVVSLLRLKKANVKEISLDSGVPRNKLYAIIKNFEKRGLVELIPDESKTYRLLNLKTFVSDRLRERKKELSEMQKNFRNFENIQGDGEFVFSLIKGQRAIMDRLAEVNPKVRKEIIGVQRNWKVWGAGLREIQRAVKRGVDVRLIGVVNEETLPRVIEWKKTGCKIRRYNEKYGSYPLRFTIFDNKEARITIGKPEIQDPKNYITIWTKSKPLIAILRAQFIEMWKNSVPAEKICSRKIYK